MDKRTLSLFAALLLPALLLLLPASGQTCDHPAAADAATCDPVSRSLSDCEPMAADSLKRIDTVDSDLVALRRTADGDEVVLEVAGFGLTLSPLSEEKMKDRSARVKTPRFNLVALYKTEVGFNIPTGTDYGGYPAGGGRILRPAGRQVVPSLYDARRAELCDRQTAEVLDHYRTELCGR